MYLLLSAITQSPINTSGINIHALQALVNCYVNKLMCITYIEKFFKEYKSSDSFLSSLSVVEAGSGTLCANGFIG